MIGLKRGTVELCDHEAEWEENAACTIKKLKKIFGAAASDIQHVGSTSIVHIKAKPIIDIAVAVDSLHSGLTCPANYGSIKGVSGGDGEESDVLKAVTE